MNKQDKLLSLLGLARRAGRLEAGFEASREAARSGRSTLLAAAGDISDKTWKELRYEAGRAKIPAVRIPWSMEALGKACGVRAGIVSVNDRGFTGALLKELERTQAERTAGDEDSGIISREISGINETDDRSDPAGREKEEEAI